MFVGRADQLGELEVVVVAQVDRAAFPVAQLNELAAETETKGRLPSSGVLDGDLARRVVGVGDALLATISVDLLQSAVGVIVEVAVRVVGIRYGEQGMLPRGPVAGIVRVVRGAIAGRRGGQEVLARGVVLERGYAVILGRGPQRIGDEPDPAGGVVVQQELIPVGMGQTGQPPIGVAQGDPVAVGVFQVIQEIVGAELPGGLVGFGQAVRPAGEGQGGIIARRRAEGAVTVVGEEAIRTTGPPENNVPVAELLNTKVPVVAPPAAQRAQLIAGVDRLAVDTAEDQRQAGGRRKGIDRAGQIAVRAQGSRSLGDLEVPERLDIGHVLPDAVQVVDVVGEHRHVVAPGIADLLGKIPRNRCPCVVRHLLGSHLVGKCNPIDGRGVGGGEGAESKRH